MKIQFVFAAPRQMPKLGEMGEQVSPPLGILYLAGYVRNKIKNLDIKAIDGPKKGFNQTLNEIREFNPDVLCVSYYTVSALGAYELINLLKDKNPSLLVITGGHHVTAMPGESLNRSKTDIEVYGEGEATLTEIIQRYLSNKKDFKKDFNKILGIGYLGNGQLNITPQRPFIHDLDLIPFPARDLININEYRGWYISKQNPQARIIFSRGCPYRCTFCSNKVWNRPGSSVRLRSPKSIADELELLKKDYGIKEFFDDGDELNNNIPHAIEICKEIKNRQLDMTWKCQLRCNNLPEELVKAMAEAGCWYVHLGIESGNQRTLNGIRKAITLKQAEETCQLLTKYGIKTLALFMLFNVWEENGKLAYEGVRETKNTLRFAKKLLKNKTASFISSTQTQPYPGSELYNIAIKHGLIKENLINNWDAWLRDDMYIMRVPGVKESDMALMRMRANVIIAIHLLKSGNISVRDLTFFVKKGLKLIEDNVKARLKKPTPDIPV